MLHLMLSRRSGCESVRPPPATPSFGAPEGTALEPRRTCDLWLATCALGTYIALPAAAESRVPPLPVPGLSGKHGPLVWGVDAGWGTISLWLLASLVAWTVAAAAFEYGYGIVCRRCSPRLRKLDLCALYWIGLCVLGAAIDGVFMSWQLAIFPVMLAHTYLCDRFGNERISLEDLLDVARYLASKTSQGLPRLFSGIRGRRSQ